MSCIRVSISIYVCFCVCSKIINGWRRTLLKSDIWLIRDEDSCGRIVPAFRRNWYKEFGVQLEGERNVYT